jgi:hypothetical protein
VGQQGDSERKTRVDFVSNVAKGVADVVANYGSKASQTKGPCRKGTSSSSLSCKRRACDAFNAHIEVVPLESIGKRKPLVDGEKV